MWRLSYFGYWISADWQTNTFKDITLDFKELGWTFSPLLNEKKVCRMIDNKKKIVSCSSKWLAIMLDNNSWGLKMGSQIYQKWTTDAESPFSQTSSVINYSLLVTGMMNKAEQSIFRTSMSYFQCTG